MNLQNLLKPILVIMLSGVSLICVAQVTEKPDESFTDGNWYINASMGVQMSGIKDEDFIKHNFVPLVNISAGKRLTPVVALQIGIKGFYFNTIGDNIRHHYSFYYGEAVFNLNELILKNRNTSNWSLNLHAGSGYFYNAEYQQPNICANVGIQNNYRIANHLSAICDLSAIMGWDIYQGDEDIIPSLSFGLSYAF
jgi:hypothetical protein